jgi:hypothetical protein
MRATTRSDPAALQTCTPIDSRDVGWRNPLAFKFVVLCDEQGSLDEPGPLTVAIWNDRLAEPRTRTDRCVCPTLHHHSVFAPRTAGVDVNRSLRIAAVEGEKAVLSAS